MWSSADGAAWQLQTHAPWEPRHTAGYVVHQNKMWIVGGDANQRHYQSDVWSSSDGVRWVKVGDRVPWAPRVLHCTVAHKGKIWIMGGQTLPQFAPAPEAFHNDVWNTPDGVHWTRVLASAPWSPRGMIGGSAVFRDRIWILGGGTYDTPQHPARRFYNDVWSSADGVHWQLHVEHAPWKARQYHDVAVFDNKMWVIGGRLNNVPYTFKNDVWFSTNGATWTQATGAARAANGPIEMLVVNAGIAGIGHTLAGAALGCRRIAQHPCHRLAHLASFLLPIRLRFHVCRDLVGGVARDVRLERQMADEIDQSSRALDRSLVARSGSPSEKAQKREQAVKLADALLRRAFAPKSVHNR